MAADGVQRLDLKGLDAVLERAKAEGWTELALVGPYVIEHAVRLIGKGWLAARVFVLS